MKKLHLALSFLALVFLTACNKEGQVQVESPEVVLEKSITQSPLTFESESTFSLEMKNPLDESSTTSEAVQKDKVDLSDPDYFEIESVSTSKMTTDSPDIGTFTIDSETDFKYIDGDIYVGYRNLDFDTKETDLPEIQTLMSTFLKPYLDETFHLALNDLEALVKLAMENLEKETSWNLDYELFATYSFSDLREDLAQSGLLVVAKDHGLEQIQSLSDEKVTAYHYNLKLNPEGVTKFILTLNDRFKITDPAELKKQLEGDLGSSGTTIKALIEILNQSFTYEAWIGQKDYHLYKWEVTVSEEEVKSFFDAIKDLSKDDSTEEELSLFLTEGEFSLQGSGLSTPIEPFVLEKPTNVIELGPFIDMLESLITEELMSFESDAVASDEQAEENDLSDAEVYNGYLIGIHEVAILAYNNYTDFSGELSIDLNEENVTRIEEQYNSTFEEVTSIREELEFEEPYQGDSTLKDALVADLDDLIDLMEKEEKELLDLWKQMSKAEGELLQEDIDKETEIINVINERNDEAYERLNTLQEEFAQKHGYTIESL